MASLTGNKIKDTYTSLLKVGDNSTIDGSAQALTDGAGNALGLTLTNTGIIVSTNKGTLIGTSSTGEVSSTMIADNAVTATQLNISGNGTSGQLIQSDGDGSFSYTAASSGDITGVTAGTGLSGGGTSGAVTVSLGASTTNSFTMGGNGSTGGVTVNDGSIQVRTGTGNVAEMRMYCESSNAHYQTIKAAPHSAASSAVLTLPTATGTLVATGDTGSVAAGMIAADAVGYSKLGAEFTTIVALGSGTEVNWANGQVFTKTLGANTALTFTGVQTGMQINLVISGNYSLTLPTSVKEITANYAGADGEQLISIVSTNGNTEQFATINKVV